MMRYKFLIKAIDEYTKCKATAQALKIGSTGVWRYLRNEEGEITGSTLTYDNGVTITYSGYDEVASVTYNGEEIKYLDNNIGENNEAYDFFKDQKENLIKEYGEDGYRMFSQFAYMYHTSLFEPINTAMREKNINYVKDYLTNTMQFDDDDCDWIIENSDKFIDMLENNPLKEYPSFVTLRGTDELYDSITKKIVSDKGFNSQSVGMPSRELMDIFGGEFDGMDEGWLIITSYSQSNSARKGAYLESAIFEGYQQIYGADSYGYGSGEFEFLAPPNQKFMRTIIDEENRIIIQEPYEP